MPARIFGCIDKQYFRNINCRKKTNKQLTPLKKWMRSGVVCSHLESEIGEPSSNSNPICYILLHVHTLGKGINPLALPSYGLNRMTSR